MSGRVTIDDFRAWETWGRGWFTSDFPNALSPPLFALNYRQPSSVPFDDGVREPWYARFAKLVTGPSAPRDKGEEPSSVGELLDGPEAASFRDLVRLKFRADGNYSGANALKVSGPFIESLRFASSSISFEFIREKQRTELQIVLRSEDQEHVSGQLAAFFPKTSIEVGEIEGSLVDLKYESPPLVVEFALGSSFFLPLRLAENFVVDPFTGLIGAFEQFGEGDIGVYQILFEPLRDSWSESISEVYRSGFFETVESGIERLVRRKVKGPLYAVVARLGVVSSSRSREMELARSVSSALVAFDQTEGNELIPISNDEDETFYDDHQHFDDLKTRRSRRFGMILSQDELVGLVHMPSGVVAESLFSVGADEKRAPSLPMGQIYLGANIVAGATTEVGLPTEYRSRHMHVIGASGSGKSNFLLHIIRQDITIRNSTIVIDPHGDLVDALFGHIAVDKLDNVILFDVEDDSFPIGFNPLTANSDRERMQLESDIVSIFRRFSTSWGDQMTTILSNAIQLVLEAKGGETIADVRRVLSDARFRKQLLETVEDPECHYFWAQEFPQIKGTPITSIVTRLNAFFRPKAIRHILAQRNARFDFEAAVNSGKTILFRIPQGAIGEENTFILGSLILAKLNLIAQGRASLEQEKRHMAICYVDEFHNMMTPSLVSMLEGARKYGLGLVLAHQDLRQLDSRGESIGSSLLTNAATRLVFKVSDADARILEREFSSFSNDSLTRLGIGECICRIGSASNDFNLKIPHVRLKDEERGTSQHAQVRDQSRKQYGRTREEVARDLFGRIDSPGTSKPSEPTVDATVEEDSPSEEENVQPKSHDDSEPRETSSPRLLTSGQQVSEKNTERLVDEDEITEVEPLPSDEPKPSAPASPGRGGRRHKALQRRLQEVAHSVDLKADIEFEIKAGGGSVDLLVKHGDISVACEIGITTSIDHEVENVRKCLKAGYTYVLAISDIESRRKKIRSGVRNRESRESFDRTRYFSVEETEHFLKSLSAKGKATERTVRGYKVRRSVSSVSKREQLEKEDVIEKTLADALDAKRRKSGNSKRKK